MSGAESGAHAGTLSIMIGGEAALVETCRPILEVLGKQIFHLGGVGMGEMAKIVNNLMAIVNQQSTREGFRLARMAGIEREKMLEVILASSGNSWAAENWEMLRDIALEYPGGPEGMAQVGY